MALLTSTGLSLWVSSTFMLPSLEHKIIFQIKLIEICVFQSTKSLPKPVLKSHGGAVLKSIKQKKERRTGI